MSETGFTNAASANTRHMTKYLAIGPDPHFRLPNFSTLISSTIYARVLRHTSKPGIAAADQPLVIQRLTNRLLRAEAGWQQ